MKELHLEAVPGGGGENVGFRGDLGRGRGEDSSPETQVGVRLRFPGWCGGMEENCAYPSRGGLRRLLWLSSGKALSAVAKPPLCMGRGPACPVPLSSEFSALFPTPVGTRFED